MPRHHLQLWGLQLGHVEQQPLVPRLRLKVRSQRHQIRVSHQVEGKDRAVQRLRTAANLLSDPLDSHPLWFSDLCTFVPFDTLQSELQSYLASLNDEFIVLHVQSPPSIAADLERWFHGPPTHQSLMRRFSSSSALDHRPPWQPMELSFNSHGDGKISVNELRSSFRSRPSLVSINRKGVTAQASSISQVLEGRHQLGDDSNLPMERQEHTKQTPHPTPQSRHLCSPLRSDHRLCSP